MLSLSILIIATEKHRPVGVFASIDFGVSNENCFIATNDRPVVAAGAAKAFRRRVLWRMMAEACGAPLQRSAMATAQPQTGDARITRRAHECALFGISRADAWHEINKPFWRR